MDSIDKVHRTVKEYSSIVDLKNGVLTGEYTDTHPDFSRCFLWKSVFLLGSLDCETWLANFEASRSTYKFLSQQYRPPFGLLEPESPYYEPVASPISSPISQPPKPMKPNHGAKYNLLKRATNSSSESPLSVTSPKNSSLRTFSNASTATIDDDVSELNTIIIDIERTFPGLPLFKNIKVKKDIIKVLFVWYKLNQDIGYRQGMHEIVSLIYMIVQAESFAKPLNGLKDPKDVQVFEIFNKDAILADVFHMFTIFMINPQSSFYNEGNLMNNCKKFDELLKDFDYDLYYYMNNQLKLESQIWLIRWLRLMLIRELTLSTVLPFWDRLICFQKIKNFSNLTSNNDFNTILNILVLLLLLKIKKQLFIDCSDYGDVLKLLLNYPVQDIFQDQTLTKKFNDGFTLEEMPINEHVIQAITEMFNEAVLVFNSRRSLKSIGKFLNEKYNKDFINLYESRHHSKTQSIGLDSDTIQRLRFEKHLENRVHRAITRQQGQ